jgi:ubiquitin-conjugating enzyme E2 J1
MQEARELANDPCTDYSAAPLEACVNLSFIFHAHRISNLHSLRMTSLCVFPSMFPHLDLRKLQEWHCTLRGSPGTEFEGGLYHFRILLPSEYPFRPPSIVMLTPSGRFELNTKVCIPILIRGHV